MIQLNKKFSSKANVNLCIWIFLFAFLSSPLISSIAHAQEHISFDEHNCDACSLIEESHSDVIQSSLPFKVLFKESPLSEVITLSILCFTAICLSNSDPPINL
jgi:hypothetical protein